MDTIVLAPGGYLLDPDLGSDYERPWRLAKGLAGRGFRVVLVAREVRQVAGLGPNVEVANPPGRLPNSPVGRLLDRIRLYWHAREVAYREIRLNPTTAVHHLGPCSVHSPSLMGRLPVPFVYGPVPASRPMDLEDDEWLSWLRTPRAHAVQAYLSKAAVRVAGTPAEYLWRRTMAQADAVTVEAAANSPAERPDTVVIPPGIDPSQFQPDRHRAVPGRVVGAGRFLKRKGYDVLIRAMARLAGRDPRAHLLLVGDGPEAPNLRLLAHQVGLDSRVQFTGNVSRLELAALLQSGEIFCHPAIWDNVPFAILEAMATGLPILASSAGGLPDTVVDAGIIHRLGDETALANDLLQLLNNAPLRRKLGARARERVLNHLTWDAMCDSYADLYRRLFDSVRRSKLLARGS